MNNANDIVLRTFSRWKINGNSWNLAQFIFSFWLRNRKKKVPRRKDKNRRIDFGLQNLICYVVWNWICCGKFKLSIFSPFSQQPKCALDLLAFSSQMMWIYFFFCLHPFSSVIIEWRKRKSLSWKRSGLIAERRWGKMRADLKTTSTADCDLAWFFKISFINQGF